MSEFMTPAMFEIALGNHQELPIDAFHFADEQLIAQGINPIELFRNTFIQDQHTMVALSFFHGVMSGRWPKLPEGPIQISLPPVAVNVEFRPIAEESTETEE